MLAKDLNLQKCSTVYSKTSFDSNTENFHSDTVTQEILKIAQLNYDLAHQYFQGDTGQQLSRPFTHRKDNSNLVEFIPVERKKLTKILSILSKTRTILQQKFGTEIQNNNNQYQFLRDIWTTHSKHRSSLDWEDCCDGLNKNIAMIKNRVKLITEKEQKEKNRFWEQEVQENTRIQDNPLFEKMQEKFSSQQMKIEEMRSKLCEQSNRNQNLSRKVTEFERKMQIMKQKNKKGEKKLFEMTKEKVNLEKKVFDMEVKIDKRQGKQNYLQNKTSMYLDLSGVRMIQQSFVDPHDSPEPKYRTERSQSEAVIVSNIEAAIRKKYKKKNNEVQKQRTLLMKSSSNSALNSSITTMKFQRTNSKRSGASRKDGISDKN